MAAAPQDTAERYEELEAHLQEAHDYDTPEIIAILVVRGSAGYLGRVSAETAPVTSASPVASSSPVTSERPGVPDTPGGS